MYIKLTYEQWLSKVGDKIEEVLALGYKPDINLGISCAGIAYVKDNHVWAFSLDGEIVEFNLPVTY